MTSDDVFTTTIDAFYSDFKDDQIKRGIELPLYWGTGTLQPNATVTNGYVRGLASAMRAVLMQSADGARFWVAIRAENKQDQPELRYYSNDPAWTAKLPQTIDGWSDGYQEHPPVRLMSAGGRVSPSL